MDAVSADYKPDLYALRSFILDQFEQFTKGDTILIYADGQTRYVHRYDCVTYHIADPNTQRARCVLNCLAFVDDGTQHPGKCELSYFTTDSEGNTTMPTFSDVLIMDQMVLYPDDMVELLMSHRIYDHLVKYGYA